MRSAITVIVLGLAVVCCCPRLILAQRAPERPRPLDVVYVAGKPVIVVANDAGCASFSPDGRYALVCVTPAPSDDGMPVTGCLVTSNVLTGKVKTTWRVSTPAIVVEDVLWFAGTSVALVELRYVSDDESSTAECTFLRINARTGIAKVLQEATPDAEYSASPTRSVIVSCVSDEGTADLAVIRHDGAVSRRLHVRSDAGADGIVWCEGWCPDGIRVRVMSSAASYDGEGYKVPAGNKTWRRWNTLTGELRDSAAEPPTWKPPVKQLPFSLSNDPVPISNGPAKATIRPIWLIQGSDKACRRQLISPDSDWSKVSPAGTDILVRSRGAVALVHIKRISGEAVDALRKEERTDALFRASCIGAALKAYTQDNAGRLAPAGDRFESAISPLLRTTDYLTSPGTGSAFVYAPVSTTALEAADAASTSLGYLPMDNGHAVVYADGHAAWDSD